MKDKAFYSESVTTVDSDIFFHGDAHVNEEFFDGFSLVTGKDDFLLFGAIIIVFDFTGALVFFIGFVLLSNVAVAFKVLS